MNKENKKIKDNIRINTGGGSGRRRFSGILLGGKKLGIWVKQKKIWVLFSAVFCISMLYLAFGVEGQSNGTGYVLDTVKRGDMILSVTGSGNISALENVEIKSKVSEVVLSVPVKEGGRVEKGDLLVELDSRSGRFNVKSAETELLNSSITLGKMKKPPEDLAVIQSDNALSQSRDLNEKAAQDLDDALNQGFDVAVDTFADLPSIVLGLEGMAGGAQGRSISYYAEIAAAEDDSRPTLYDKFIDKYADAKNLYSSSLQIYKNTLRSGDDADVEKLILATESTTRALADAVKSAQNIVGIAIGVMLNNGQPAPSQPSTVDILEALKDEQSLENFLSNSSAENQKSTPVGLAGAQKSDLDSFAQKLNAHMSDLNNVTRSISDSRFAVKNSERTIQEKESAFEKMKGGTDPLEISMQNNIVEEKANDLSRALYDLQNFSIRAPFDGLVGSVQVSRGGTVFPGNTMMSLISDRLSATIPLNEVDVAKISVGDQAVLTLEAIPDLKLTGEVYSIDAVGTPVQGVIVYNTEILIESEDERLKPGMSVSAEISALKKENVLYVPNSALVFESGEYFVSVVPEGGSEKDAVNKPVTIGVSNNTATEITGGLEEGETILLKRAAANEN